MKNALIIYKDFVYGLKELWGAIKQGIPVMAGFLGFFAFIAISSLLLGGHHWVGATAWFLSLGVLACVMIGKHEREQQEYKAASWANNQKERYGYPMRDDI